ncbi:Mu transposase C-terminal domain-containing protein [Ruminococcaceae bacterium OttesenSCG-928-D13]|nr:Mu transposase C-terminal domain-containing protein [Ruminococcaceae bacterium OttesenSCG-928-D13]
MVAAHALQPNTELTVAEVAGLMGCSPRYVRQQVSAGQMPAAQRVNERNRPIYYIPLSALDPKLQRRYLKGQGGGGGGGKQVVLPDRRHKPLEQFSLAEQTRIQFWCRLLDEWQHYRHSREGAMAALDAKFIAYAEVRYQDEYQRMFGREFELSAGTLYRRWAAFKEQDLGGLLDKRGQAVKGKSAIQPVVWDAFLYYYLDENQPTVARCYDDTGEYIREAFPELHEDIPSVHSFYRKLERDLPKALEVLGRQGEKALRDRYGPYIRREYENMDSNEFWVADTHTLDVLSEGEDGKMHRLYLVAFFDARSGIFVGCHITDQPSSQATLLALRRAIQKYGIPENIYVDNGREFLTHDVGGLGHRAKKKNKDEFVPPPVFERLGIKMVNALVRNARAKVIERRFRDVKEFISRLFPTYTGGNVLEKPEALKYNLKAGRVVADQELLGTVELLLFHYLNEEPYGGSVARDRGKTRMQVYGENLHSKRVAREDDLNLLMMRSSRMQTVGRRGVHLDIGGIRYDYFNEELLLFYSGKKVFYRYDPDDLSSVRVYDEEGRFLTVAPVDDVMVMEYGASKDDVSAAVRAQRQFERAVKAQLKDVGLEALNPTEAVQLRMAKALRAKDAERKAPAPGVIELETVQETARLPAAVGGRITDRMLESAKRMYGGGSDNE